MASGQGSRTQSGRKRTQTQKKRSGTRRNSNNTRNKRQDEPMDFQIRNELILIGLFALTIFLFLCNFGIAGVAGNYISDFMFGIFGLTAYLAPIVLFLGAAFGMSNSGSTAAMRKLVAGVVLFVLAGMACELFAGVINQGAEYQLSELYLRCSKEHNGGGIIAGSLAYLSYHFLSLAGTVLLIFVLLIVCIVVVTEKSLVGSVKHGGKKMYERSREETIARKERARLRREEMEEERQAREEEQRIKKEEQENEKILRMNKKVTGVMLDTTIPGQKEEQAETVRDDIHEIVLNDMDEDGIVNEDILLQRQEAKKDEKNNLHAIHFDEIHITTMDQSSNEEEQGGSWSEQMEELPFDEELLFEERKDAEVAPTDNRPKAVLQRQAESGAHTSSEKGDLLGKELTAGAMSTKVPKKYSLPPVRLLAKGVVKGNSDGAKLLKETAMHLQQTLNTFGVKVTITDISQGPAVTRYELQPEQGVKVSKIVGLTDDIKLNLAATDIRIEAPIPGKAAVGIEVPNKENSAVALRDLLESKEFREFPSKLAFAVGKDIGGQTVVADIARMPHMLIAGSTGSGKSVCINTLIMSILYKAHPDEVKLIMVDPKVVELSVYNGIPHLLIPVVTDPKKAAAALHWGVAEMTERYKRFADFNVRDLKGYNKAVEGMKERGEADVPPVMPQIVIIVDELADLMMVAPGEVEESICRLAQLARAAGIHLIIATQRPSVDVITGLIKANMPSRVAFAVSSGVDSRTILDMNGAEKLLGKGDMLFYPQGYAKPARVQGAFVSDKEVSDVVDFLKNQAIGNVYAEDVEEKIQNMGSAASSSGSAEGSGESRDQYFVEAGRFIIEKDKASIGMLQRVFKIGFNRAARIMDQLADAGIVGEEEGTKPRKVLMSMEEFERLIEEEI